MRLTPLLLLFFGMIYLSNSANSQVINGYAKVTSLSGATLTLSNVNEAAHTFEDDEWVVLMQMQDDVIGTTTNTVGFGDLGSISSAGLYEIRQIDSHTESLGLPATITLKNVPTNTYNTCPNCSVQIITFREYGSPDYTTTADMSSLPWDGNIGGVLSFSVDGTLTLAHNLDADGDGFRGAAVNTGGSTGCSGTSNFRVATTANHADKGEGIYKSTDLTYAAGRGRILSGGGGGNSHNAGGGGGGNYSGGGTGGPGWPTCSPTAGGIGGLILSGVISGSRVFMGGGGGSGEGNNGFATPGTNAGGIVLIKATEITTGTCGAGVNISANANSVVGTSGNDGAGAGGAGGSIVLNVDIWSISAACPLTISSNGGDGGSVNSGATHGGGAGGGQGYIFFSSSIPTTNITSETLNGDGGCNNNSVPCNSQAESGTGTDNMGIHTDFGEPLPIELLDFSGELIHDEVLLKWITASERNNDYFNIEHSIDGENWSSISYTKGAGNSTSKINYSSIDYHPHIGLNYYRLKQTDFDGSYSYSESVSILYQTDKTVIFPNPSNQFIHVVGDNINATSIQIFNPLGKQMPVYMALNEHQLTLDVSGYPSGVYILNLVRNDKKESHRLTVIN